VSAYDVERSTDDHCQYCGAESLSRVISSTSCVTSNRGREQNPLWIAADIAQRLGEQLGGSQARKLRKRWTG
jgi:hypothetical protein